MSVGPLGAFPAELESPAAQLEPQSVYAAFHAESPVRYDPERGCWDVFGYDLVKEVANDHDRFSVELEANPDFIMPEDGLITGKSMLYRDPPRHDELRAVVDDFFTPGAISALEPQIEATTHAFVDQILEDATGDSAVRDEPVTFDLVQALSYPLPVSVIATMIGVPTEDRAQFREWSTYIVAASGHEGPDETRLQQFRDSLIAYFDELVVRRREQPQDDLMSKVVATDGLDIEELRGFFSILLIAGNVTTTNAISNAVWCFAEHDTFETVRDDPAALETALEEVLRYRSPVQTHTRYAVKETELGGETIEPGDKIGVWFGAANHDPTVFDSPAQFVPDRKPNPHVAFGHGTHFCLGAHLARLEMRVALRVLLERFDTIEVHTDELQPSGSMLVYGPSSMPVTAWPHN